MSKRNAYPTKTTLNLMMRERRGGDPRILVPATLVGVVLLALFCRFAVVERLYQAVEADKAALAAELALARAEDELTAYDEVEAQYTRYFSDALFTDEIPQECMDVLAMMESNLMQDAWVSAYSFSGNTLRLRLHMPRLDVTSELIEALYRVPMVETVSIATATDVLNISITDNTRESTGESAVVMTITLREVAEQ